MTPLDRSTSLERWSRILIATLTGGALVLAWSIFTVESDIQHHLFLDGHAKKLSRSARAIASTLDSTMGEIHMALRILNQQAAAHPGQNYTASAEFESLARVVRSPSWGTIDLRAIDRHGHLRTFNGSRPQVDLDLSIRDYFQAQVPYSGEHPYIGRPVHSSFNGHWTINVSVGLPPESGDLAVLAVGLEFPFLDRLVSNRLEEEQSVSLLRGDGTLLYQYPLPSEFPSRRSAMDWFSIQAAGTDAGLIPGSVAKVFQRTEVPGLVVVVSRPSEGLDRLWIDDWKKTLGWMVVVTLAILGAGCGLWFIESRLRFQRRTQEMLARVDPLTGLLNRRAFDESCAIERLRVDRIPGGLGLGLLDLDHFKKINDRYGHPTGDRVLKEFAATLLTVLRATDVVARIGGEEFAVLLPGTSEAKALEIAERLRSEVAQITLPDGHLTTSIGLSVWNGEESLDRWYQRTDQALYQAKVQGRNRVVASPGPQVRSGETASRPEPGSSAPGR